MYKGYLYKYVIIMGLLTFIYMLCNFICYKNMIFGVIYEILIFISLILAKLYMDNYNNKYIENNFKELFVKYKSKIYDYKKNSLAFEIYLDIKKNKIKVEAESDLYKVAREGVYFIVYECLGLLIAFMNFVFLTI